MVRRLDAPENEPEVANERVARKEVVHFKQPIFQIMVLFVDEAESVARQLKRGRQVVAHNEEIARSGVGERWEERATGLQRGARTQPLPGLQGANLRRTGFPQRDLPLPLPAYRKC